MSFASHSTSSSSFSTTDSNGITRSAHSAAEQKQIDDVVEQKWQYKDSDGLEKQGKGFGLGGQHRAEELTRLGDGGEHRAERLTGINAEKRAEFDEQWQARKQEVDPNGALLRGGIPQDHAALKDEFTKQIQG